MSETVTELRIRISDSADVDVAHQLAEHDDRVTVQEASAPGGDLNSDVEPITALLIGGAVVAVGKFVADWWDRRKGGLVIDLRPDATHAIQRSEEVPAGYVVIFAAEGGKVEVETKAQPEDAIERLISQVISGTFKTGTDLAKLARDVLEGDPEVKEEA